MRRLISTAVAFLSGGCFFALTSLAHAQNATPEGWQGIPKIPDAVVAGTPYYRPDKDSSAFHLDRTAMAAVLKGVPMENTPAAANPLRMHFPMPDGTLAAFDVVESPNFPEELAARFPEIKSYAGKGVDHPTDTIRFDLSPLGFHAMMLTGGFGAVSIDRYTKDNLDYYTSFAQKSYPLDQSKFTCHTNDVAPPFADREQQPGRSGDFLRVYRLAVSTTGEFTQATGGTVATGLAAVNSNVNDINTVYITEFSIRFQLAARNDLIIFTNPDTDPFSAPLNPVTTSNENTNAINTRIGSASYDVGHVEMVLPPGSGFSGVSLGLGLVCDEARKAKAYTSAELPTGFVTAVRVMAHELGHQFGAAHSWNFSCPGLIQQRSGSTAYEPGTGSTIMSYGGNCGGDPTCDMQDGPDVMFNSGAFDQIYSFVSTGNGANCGTRTNTTNTPPTADAGPDYNIPKGTPFTLTGSGTDADNDALLYSWEQRSLGDPISILTPDDGRSPIIRVRPLSMSPSRTIPILSALQSGTLDPGEQLPTQARTMPFRLTVRDGHMNDGGIATANMNLIISGRAGPFFVTAPTNNLNWTGVQTVTWAVNGTAQDPINCSAVNILLSTDNGVTFPTVLAANVPNNGSHEVVLPNTTSTNARIKIEAVGNIFFAFSSKFNIRPPVNGVQIGQTGVIQVDDRFGNGNNNQLAEPGESTVGIRFGIRNSKATTATGVVGTLTTTTPGVTIKRGTVSYPNLPFGVSVINDTPFVIAVGPNVPCGGTIALHIAVAATPRSNGAFDFTIPVGLPARPGEPQIFTYNAFPVPIPDFPNPSAKIRINVSGVGTIGNVKFRLNGDACSTVIGATGVGIDHPAVGDLQMSLISPDGTPVLLFDQPGAMSTPTEGNNFCQTTFDDAALTSIQDIRDEDNPYTGSYRPQNPMSGFNGHPADGIWVIDVADQRFGFTGNLRSASIIVSPQIPATCLPPAHPPCPGDLDDGTGAGIPDGGVTIDDLLYYLNQYALGSSLADLDDGSGTGTPDGGVTIDDLIFMIDHFAAGC